MRDRIGLVGGHADLPFMTSEQAGSPWFAYRRDLS
jgi:hypothetical protein